MPPSSLFLPPVPAGGGHWDRSSAHHAAGAVQGGQRHQCRHPSGRPHRSSPPTGAQGLYTVPGIGHPWASHGARSPISVLPNAHRCGDGGGQPAPPPGAVAQWPGATKDRFTKGGGGLSSGVCPPGLDRRRHGGGIGAAWVDPCGGAHRPMPTQHPHAPRGMALDRFPPWRGGDAPAAMHSAVSGHATDPGGGMAQQGIGHPTPDWRRGVGCPGRIGPDR